MIPITVITPTYRVGSDLWKFTLSVQKQLSENDELIIVDNDRSRYAKKIGQLEKVQYYPFPENKGPCPARNYGANLAKNEWLLFLDDDGIAPDGMLDALRRIINENPNFYAIRGKVIAKNDYIYNYMQSHYDMGDKAIPYYLNLECIVAIKKTEFDAVGCWDDDLYGHEGEELTYRLLNRYGPENCQYHPGLVFHHDYSDCLLKYLKKGNRHLHNSKNLGCEYDQYKPVIDSYKRLSPYLHETMKTMPQPIRKKIQFILDIKDICSRHPLFKRILFTLLQAFRNIGIKI